MEVPLLLIVSAISAVHSELGSHSYLLSLSPQQAWCSIKAIYIWWIYRESSLANNRTFACRFAFPLLYKMRRENSVTISLSSIIIARLYYIISYVSWARKFEQSALIIVTLRFTRPRHFLLFVEDNYYFLFFPFFCEATCTVKTTEKKRRRERCRRLLSKNVISFCCFTLNIPEERRKFLLRYRH